MLTCVMSGVINERLMRIRSTRNAAESVAAYHVLTYRGSVSLNCNVRLIDPRGSLTGGIWLKFSGAMQSVEPPINGRFAEGLWADRVTYDVDPTCRAQARAGCCCGEADCIPAVGLL